MTASHDAMSNKKGCRHNLPGLVRKHNTTSCSVLLHMLHFFCASALVELTLTSQHLVIFAVFTTQHLSHALFISSMVQGALS